MHPTEPKKAFIMMRGNGWSLGKISNKLQVPKSTLFRWESDDVNRRTINVIKSLQVEKLQENYIPSFEEELQQLSKCLTRVEHALDKQDFETMRPEFLLRTALQLRSRLHKFRTNVQPTHILNEGEPSPVHGCISHSPTEIPDLADVSFSSPSPGGEGVPLRQEGGLRGEVPSARQNGTKRDEKQNSEQPEHSPSATSTDENGTIVPFCDQNPDPASSPESQPDHAPQAGTKRDDNNNSSTTEHSAPTTSNPENGTIVPFSQPRPDTSSPDLVPSPGHRSDGNLQPSFGTATPRPDGALSLTASFAHTPAGKPPVRPLPSVSPKTAAMHGSRNQDIPSRKVAAS